MFVVPALVLGLLVSLPLRVFMFELVFQSERSTGFEIMPETYAILMTLGVGIAIPVFSSIVPVMRIWSQNLADSLNIQRSRVKAFYVEIIDKTKS